MTTEEKAKIVRKKKGSEEDIITKMTKHLQKKFPKRELEVKTTSDDGGKVLEVHVNEPKLSRAVRDFLPLSWEGWRTVVINRYATSGAE